METTQESSQKTSIHPSRSKAGKGWMICAIILAVVLVAGGTFAAIIIAKGNRDTNRLSEVEAQLKEKETKEIIGKEKEEFANIILVGDEIEIKKIADENSFYHIAYVIDVCVSNGKFYLVELNPFSGADFYNCDAKKIIESLENYLNE